MLIPDSYFLLVLSFHFAPALEVRTARKHIVSLSGAPSAQSPLGSYVLRSSLSGAFNRGLQWETPTAVDGRRTSDSISTAHSHSRRQAVSHTTSGTVATTGGWAEHL